MKHKKQLKVYSRTEEAFNIYSHAIGIIMGIVASYLFLTKSIEQGSIQQLLSGGIFGLSLIVLYTASTLYHATKNPKRRMIMNIVDHSAIFILIAGTYTPFSLVTLEGNTGLALFLAVWIIAGIGILLKTRFTGRFRILSTILYVAMGWLAILVVMPLYRNMAIPGLLWLLAGGISYTTGAVIYSIKRIPFNHAIFHMFVLIGSATHIICVYQYVL